MYRLVYRHIHYYYISHYIYIYIYIYVNTIVPHIIVCVCVVCVFTIHRFMHTCQVLMLFTFVCIKSFISCRSCSNSANLASKSWWVSGWKCKGTSCDIDNGGEYATWIFFCSPLSLIFNAGEYCEDGNADDGNADDDGTAGSGDENGDDAEVVKAGGIGCDAWGEVTSWISWRSI